MRLNVWLILAILIVLFAMTRYSRHHPTPVLCRDDPAAAVCETVSLSKQEPRPSLRRAPKGRAA
jgi:hypothetical protein